MAVNQAGADKEIRSQLVSTLESGHNHMALAEATKAFPASAINSRLLRVPYSFWHLVEHIRLSQKDMLDYMTSTSYEEPPFPQVLLAGEEHSSLLIVSRARIDYMPGAHARSCISVGLRKQNADVGLFGDRS